MLKIFFVILIFIGIVGLFFSYNKLTTTWEIKITDWIQAFSVIALVTITIVYSVATNKIAEQTTETNLRPVILMDGFVKGGWDGLKFEYDKSGKELTSNNLLRFPIYKNIATDISGYLIRDGVKRELLFGHQVSTEKNDELSSTIQLEKVWGWVIPGSLLRAFPERDGEPTSEENKIVINYHDIEGNLYRTTIKGGGFLPISEKVKN